MKKLSVFRIIWLFIPSLCNNLSAQYMGSGFDIMSDDSIVVSKTAHYKTLGYQRLPVFTADGTVENGNYVIFDDYVIKKGVVVHFTGAAQIFIEPGVRINIDGKLITDGETRFTCVPLRHLMISRTEKLWKGIFAGIDGKLLLSNTTIENAIDGISAPYDLDTLKLECVTFRNVAGERLAVGSQLHLFSDTACLNYCHKCETKDVKAIPEIPEKIPTNTLLLKKVSLVSGIVFAIGAAGSFALNRYYYNKAVDSDNRTEIPDFENKSNTMLTLTAVSGGMFGVSAATYGICWSIELKRRNPK